MNSKNNKCIDCGVPVKKSNSRCRKCYREYVKNNKPYNFDHSKPRDEKGRILYEIICANCGEVFLKPAANVKKEYNHLCSDKCWKEHYKKTLSGKNSFNWKDEYTDFKEKLRRLLPYREWRTAVFVRDNYKCVECGKGGYLEAHHIKEFVTMLRENNIMDFEQAFACAILWEISNGQTLCKECHNKKRVGHNTRKEEVV